MNRKLDKVREYIIKNGDATTRELSSVFNVSEQTIRKYLVKLEVEGEVTRFHGGARTKSTFIERLHLNVENKKLLSKECAKYIEDGDIIYIDSSTTYYYLVDYLPDNIKVDIFTTSIPTAKRIKDTTSHNLYLIGGYVDNVTYGTFSVDSFNQISSVIFDKVFFGTSGFSYKFEFTEDNYDSLIFQKKILENSRVSIIAATSDKYDIVSRKKSFKFSEIDVFITENFQDDKFKKHLMDNLMLITI